MQIHNTAQVECRDRFTVCEGMVSASKTGLAQLRVFIEALLAETSLSDEQLKIGPQSFNSLFSHGFSSLCPNANDIIASADHVNGTLEGLKKKSDTDAEFARTWITWRTMLLFGKVCKVLTAAQRTCCLGLSLKRRTSLAYRAARLSSVNGPAQHTSRRIFI